MKRTATTNYVLNLMNVKRKRTEATARNSVYLPDECWELVFKHLVVMDDKDYHSLSLVSQQFLSITNRLRSSLTIKSSSYQQTTTTQEVLNLIKRFPNLTSLHFSGRYDLDYILPKLSTFPFRLTSLKLDNISTFPASGLLAFSITNNLNTLTCSHTHFLRSTHMFLIGDCFPDLQRLDLSHCKDIYEGSFPHLFKRCRSITHLNLTACSILPPSRIMKFQVPTLEVLNFSYSTVDDQTLKVITKSCTEILQLSLKQCEYVTHKGVERVLRNCKQLKEINLKRCLVCVNVVSMLSLRPSLTNIKLPCGVVWVGSSTDFN